MTPSSQGRARVILAAALDHDPADREALLSAACEGDAVLLAEVRALLAAHEAAPTKFLEVPAVNGDLAITVKHDPRMAPLSSSSLSPGITEQPGERMGRYKLLQELGEGGFGTVWMAEQVEPVTRRVALKIIKLGMDTREVIARFEQERQALALMDHPNIAKVLDAGATDKGRPFFVMELVKGLPITQYCDEARLGTRERLALFNDVCSAINHAHQKGVIHRDIKPSNVLVTLYADKPVVKVIDFGIAKATQGKFTDKTLFTRLEQFVGTPVYMSPEQATLSAVDIDTRSDIYGLGIMLYELLTGTLPFDAKSLVSAGYDEMRRIIREDEPPRPSMRLSAIAAKERSTIAHARRIDPAKVGRVVESDLDWIVMKAIEKDRSRRYETANGLAQDIARFLSDEPVSATPPSTGYQLRKFARRNKAALRVAAVIAGMLVAATAVSTWQAVRATRAEKRTAAERDAKEQARQDAESISTFLTEVFQSPDPAKDGREIKVADLLDKAAKKLETELATQPDRRAKLQQTLGSTYLALGLFREAIPLQEKARDYYLATSGPESSETLAAQSLLAADYHEAGRHGEALKLREEGVTLRRKILGPEHPDTLKAMRGLAISYVFTRPPDEALKLNEEVLTLSRKVNGPEHPDTLAVMNNLAAGYTRAARGSEAVKLLEEMLPLRLKVSGPTHPDTLVAMHALAGSYAAVRRWDDAFKLLEEVLKLRRKVLGPEHPATLGAMHELAGCYFNGGRKKEALGMLEEVLPLDRKVLGPEYSQTLLTTKNLARCYNETGRQDEAIKAQEEALVLSRKIRGPDHADTLEATETLAKYNDAAGRKDEAVKLRQDANPWLAKLRDSGIEVKTAKRQADNTWELVLRESKVADLSSLKGAPISWLTIGHTAVTDLAPLRGMGIKKLWLHNTPVADLSPLQGMPLEYLNAAHTKISDLSALRGMPLGKLKLHGCAQITDLSPLAQCQKLTELVLPPNAKNIELLRALPKLQRLSFQEDKKNNNQPDKTAAEFWREYDAKK